MEKESVLRSSHPSRGNVSKEGFLKTFNKCFTRILSNKSFISSNEHVLCSYSGGVSSSSMLQLLDECIPKDPKMLRRKKKMGFSYSVVFVDLSNVLPQSYDTKDVVNTVKKTFKGVNEVFTVKISKELSEKILGVKDVSEREDCLYMGIEKTILDFAKENGFNKVLFGQTATRLAVRTISLFGIGKAPDVSSQVSLEENLGDMKIVRPMKKFYAKEVAYYAHIMKTPTFFTPSFSSEMDLKNSSMEKIVEYYIHKLEKTKVDTSFTIVQTADKI